MKKIVMLMVGLALAGCRLPFGGDQAYKFSGTLEMTEHTLGSKTAGRLSTLAVKEGDVVSQGQLIATLDRYEQAKKDYERAQEVFKGGGATRQQLEQQALVVDDFAVASPIDGVVLLKIRQLGEVVATGNPIVIVGNPKELWIRVYVPESRISRVQMNTPAKIRIDGLDRTFDGRVSFISPQAEFTPRNVQTPEERATQTFAVKVSLENPPESLHPGVAADVEILVGQ